MIHQNEIDGINLLLRQALKNNSAFVEVNEAGSDLYDVILHHGIPGPVNLDYIQSHLIHVMLNGLKRLRSKKSNLALDPIVISAENNFYQIKISSLSSAYFYGDHKFSMRNCLLRFIEAERTNDESIIFSKSLYLTPAKTLHEDLTQFAPQLVNKFGFWRAKEKGYMSGLIYEGKTKFGFPKRVFVKRFEDAGTLDFAALSLAKACGVRAPKVRVATTSQFKYLFSTDIAKTKKKNEKVNTYQYYDFSEWTKNNTNYFDWKSLTLCMGRQADGSFSEQLRLDRTSVARLLLIIAILGLSDTHMHNIGLVISNKEGVIKAKLVLIDFQLDNSPLNGMTGNLDPDSRMIVHVDPNQTIADFIRTCILVFAGENSHDLMEHFAKNITEEDYIEAFELINEAFLPALEQVKPLCQRLSLDIDNIEKQKGTKRVFEERWVNNFNKVKSKIDACTQKCESSVSVICNP